MGKRRGKPRNGGKKADQPQNSGWRKNKDGTDLVIERKNELFEKFYQAQQICPEDQWDSFLETLRKDLPQAFRLVGCRKEAETLLDIMKVRYFSKLADIKVDDKSIETPKQLSWYPGGLGFQLSLPRQVLRKHADLNNLHNFLVTESELGNLSRQEAVSMIPPLLLDIKPDSKVLDMCAAPGSKTAQLIEMLHGEESSKIPTGFVLANDENNKRCYLLVHQSLKRLNSPCCLVVNNDAAILPYPRILMNDDKWHFLEFDQILCDVPCSGDGTLRKNIAIWKTWSPYHGYNMHRLQIRIAKRGLEMLAVGGLMVYSTCSLNPAENEAVIAHLLDFAKGSIELVDVSSKLPGLIRSPGLKTWKLMDRGGNFYDSISSIPEDRRRYFPDTIFPPSESTANEYHLERCLRILPHQQNTGGFFVALLKKTTEFPWVKATAKQIPLNLEDLVFLTSNKESSKAPPPRKKKKFNGYKEDPFVFLSDNDPYWKLVEDYFDIAPDFPHMQLLSRGYDETKKRNLYFVNDVLKRIMQSNDDRLKLINAGLRLFSRIEVKDGEAQIRLTQDGLSILLPYIRKRVLNVDRTELIKILSTPKPSLPFTDLSEETKKQCDNFSNTAFTFILRRYFYTAEGSVVLKCVYSEQIVAVCAWRGKFSLSAYLAKETTVHILRMLDFDTTNFENDMINLKRQKRNKNSDTSRPVREEESVILDNTEKDNIQQDNEPDTG